MSATQQTPEDALKSRVLDIKPRLPKNYTTFFIHYFPKFDNKKGKIRVRRAVNLQIADEEVTKNLEVMVKKLEKK